MSFPALKTSEVEAVPRETILSFLTISGLTKGTEEREDNGFDVDWYSCAYRGSDWWPVHVL